MPALPAVALVFGSASLLDFHGAFSRTLESSCKAFESLGPTNPQEFKTYIDYDGTVRPPTSGPGLAQVTSTPSVDKKIPLTLREGPPNQSNVEGSLTWKA